MTAAILNTRRLALPETVLPQDTTIDLLRLFGLDRAPPRRRLVCHWHRDADGKLVAAWEPEIGSAFARAGD
jgi:hypothetical protein